MTNRVQQFVSRVKKWLLWWWRYGLALALFSCLFTALVPSSTIQYNTVWERVASATSPLQFDFITWELNTIGAKVSNVLYGQSAYLAEDTRSDYVRDYAADLAHVLSLEAQIATLYSDPNIENPQEQAQILQTERDHLRDDLQTRQLLVESILEGQIAYILVEEGFGIAGQLWPPMAMRFTRMPNLLVTSPRDTIRMENSLVIDPLSVDGRAQLEDQVMATFDVSAITVPLGGIALYPAMVQESSNLSFLIETFAHEWLHHYLYFHPLGLSYFTGDGFAGEARIINETTADLFGKEIAALVIEGYYPELTPPALPTIQDSVPVIAPPDPDAFGFAAEMSQTRVRVDELLAEGEVEAAETYMEQRRIIFYENGFRLRRINQAFFAFYGGYQAGGGVAGAGGTDPIGPAVVQMRVQSDSIRDFIRRMQGITSRQQLLATLE